MKRTDGPSVGDGDMGNDGEGSVGSNGETQTEPFQPSRWGLTPQGKPSKERRRVWWSDLPRALDNLTVKGMLQLNKVLSLDVDVKTSPAVLRSLITADLGIIGHKIRVDEGALRVKHDNDVLDRLERLMKECRRTVPLSTSSTSLLPESKIKQDR